MASKSPITVSLLSSLRSERLEPLEMGTPLLEVARLLGPPRWWITDAYDEPAPLYWGYPGGLEVSFAPERPYPLSSYKLSPVGRHAGKITKFSYYRRMRNDVPIFERSPSEVLQAGIWDLSKIEVGIFQERWNPAIDICIGSLRLPFCLSTEGEEILDRQLGGSGMPSDEVLRGFDEYCGLMGIYFLQDDPKLDRPPRDGWHEMSAEDYLSKVTA